MGSAFLEEYERNIFEEGKKIGMNEWKKEVAKKMKEDKMPLEKIIQYTELDSNTIRKL
ncbi:hypothetical protein [Methanobrevibacter sp.]|uniref:hypothetical protein n=1 Tax=Methanobrevibacter sp. TaxID=66852 RepID=UPI00388D51E9